MRFVVPLFQRPYVWEKKAQWEPLWDDVSTVAERILTAGPGAPVRGHFLGSVVLEQESTGTGSVERRSVIDGQQRLTTIQLLLKAAAHAFAAAKQPTPEDGEALARAGQQVASLVANPAYATGEEAYKVWPTNEDRAPFRSVLDASRPEEVTGTGHIPGAHRFFFDEIRAWLQADGSPGPRAAALARALMHHLQVIVLDLEETDEPQAIFETLNTGGAPLSPVDLVKNWLLWEAARAGHDEASCAALHSAYWKPFDTDADYWRAQVGIGHAARPRVDGFLVNWLTERTLAPVAGGHVYETFLDKVAEPARRAAGGHADVPAIMWSIHAAAERYRWIDVPGPEGGRFTTFLHRLKAMNIVVLHPLLMYLLGRSGSIPEDLDACATALESFLVRRLVCDTGTRGYGTLFLNLLIEVAGKGPTDPAAPIINNFLAAGRSNVNVWPDDGMFARHWASRDAYKGRGARPMMILRALEEEEWRRDRLGIPVAHFDWSRVQVEHVMPQGWKEHWPLPADGDPLARDEAVQRVGNLTLVSEALNPVLSNGPWNIKRTALGKHTHLRLTASLTAQERWDEAAIEVRSARLFELACSVWPRPAVG
ncbi:DUF262 domain-containing protein [Roseomonas sp. SSH11]|uniref:DUF262 domain-containing protein n=1 Tax=Pararoseomonas baculiformis TaxID=2820812 RepID=A0ABS4AK86_9PROT|nr:DUF262 domain-containing protein [Pararoseomonas baculiformis]